MATRFQRYGNSYQLSIQNADDLEAILSLDEGLWVATSAPIAAYRCDRQFLAYLDTDANGRIYTYEVRDAIRWLLARLADRSRLAEGTGTLAFSAIRADTPEGQSLLDSIRYVLARTGGATAETVALSQLRDFMANVRSRPLNGDGVIVPESAKDAETAAFIRDILACVEGADDAGGGKGITEQHLNEFLAAVPAFLAWRERGEATAGNPSMPLGEQTPALYAVFSQYSAKVDHFFRLCRLLRYEAKSAARIVSPDAGLAILDPSKPETIDAYLEAGPLAPPTPEARLSLTEEAVNPLYRQWISELKASVLPAVLGTEPSVLTETDWDRVRGLFSGYAQYLREKKGSMVEALGGEKLERYRDCPCGDSVRRLIAADRRVTTIMTGVREAEKLLLFHQYLLNFANNFVSFPQLYAHDQQALFEMGSMVMDGRWLNLVLRVDDPAAHTAQAKLGNLFVLYAEITGAGDERFTVAAPITSGTKGNIAVGKRGVFFDITKKEYDARVTQIIENPVSLREALVMPFVRLWRLAEGKIETWSGSAEKQLQSEFDRTVPHKPMSTPPSGAAAPAPAGTAQAAPARSGAGGMYMGIGVAAAALGSSFAFITKTLAAMPRGHVLAGFATAAAMVLLPITLIAILKLRRQDLSVLLEGGGWAVNARMRLSYGQRRFFTRRATYPLGAEGAPTRRWLTAILTLLLLLLLGLGLYRALRPSSLPDTPAPTTQPADEG